MFKNNFLTPAKSPSKMFKPNTTVITKTTDDATINVIR